MKKILTFLASTFSLALLLVVLFGQPLNVNADQGAKVSLNFTEENGNFSVFSGDSYSTTKNVEVEVSGKNDESAIIEISFDATELVVTGVDGVNSDEYSVPQKGLLRIITTENNFTINFKVAEESLNVYGVPFVGTVTKLQVGNTRYSADTEFYFTRGYYGDLNLDGTINLLDYAYLRTILLGNDVTVGGKVVEVEKLADINHDGYVDFNDYNHLYNEIKNNAGNNKLAVEKFSDKVYCTVTYVEEGKEPYSVAYPFGTEVNGEKVTEHKQVTIETEVNEHKVVYFFSTAIDTTPIVDYANAGEKLELVVPNGTQLINGYIRWYSYELNTLTGKYEMVPVTDDYVMPNRDLYLYAQYSNQYFPLLVYKLNNLPTITVEYEFFDVITTDEINSMNANIDWSNELLEGYQFEGWYFDEECTTPISDFQILADTHVYAKLDPKTYQVTFVKDNGDANTVEDVKFGELVDELEVIKPGYIFLGWYEDGATTPFDFENTTMPAKSIQLTAKWLDIVKDAAEKLNAYFQELGIEEVAKVVYDETLTEVNDLSIELNIDEVLAYNKADFNTDAVKGILNAIADYCATTYTEDVLASLKVNGFDVYSDGIFKVEAIQLATVSVAGNLQNDIKLVLNGNRNVTISLDLVGSQENLDKVAEFIATAAKYVSLSYNYATKEAVVDVLVPQSIINVLEDRFDGSGKTIEEIVDNLTIKDLLLAVDKVYDSKISAEEKALIDKVVLLVLEEAFSTELVAGSSAQLTVAGKDVQLTSNAKSIDELLDELLGDQSIISELLNVKLGTFNVNGVYEIPATLVVTLPDFPQLDTNVLTQHILVRVAWKSNPHTITFEGNGADTLKVNGQDTDKATDIFGAKVYTEATRKGYAFVGWYDNPQFLGDPVSSLDQDNKVFVSVPHSNKTYYAKWEAVKYQISYDLMDDAKDVAVNDANAPVEYTVESGVVTLLAPTRPHYEFAGWYETSDYSTAVVVSFDGTDAEDKVFYAKWTPVTYVIKYTGERGNTEAGYFNREYNTLIDLTDIYQSANFTVEKAGHDIIGWNWVYLADRDDLTVQPNVVVSGDQFNIDGDILVWPTYKAQTGTITFDPNYGTVAPTSKDVVFGEAFGELPVPTREGYEFLGWYYNNVEVTSATIYNTYGTVPGTADYFNALDITLVAKWNVIDVVDNLVEGAEEIIDEVVNTPSGVDFPVTFEKETANFTNKDGETVELVNKVTVKLNLNDLAAYDNYSINNKYLDEEELLNGAKNVLAGLVKELEIVYDITVNGHIVYENGKFVQEGLRDLVEELTYTLIEDIANGNVPTFNVVVDDTVCERNVEVLLVLEGDASKLEKVETLAQKLQNHVLVVYDNHDVEVTINVPQTIVKALEAKVVANYPNATLNEVLNALTLEDLINILTNEAEDIFASNPELLTGFAKAAYKGQGLVNKLIAKGYFDIEVDGDKLFVDNASFAPASSSFEDVVKALKDIINPAILATPLSTFNLNNDSIYTLPLFVKADLTSLDLLDNNVIEVNAKVNFVLDSNEYDAVLDANGGKFANGNAIETVTGVVGEKITVEPSRDLYTFIGWKDAEGNDYTSIPNKDITLYAQWEAREYKIYYVLNNNTLALDGTFDLEYYVTATAEYATNVNKVLAEGYNVNSTFVLAVPTSVEGYYQFAGWKIGNVEITEVVGGNVQFVADAQDLIFAELAKLDAQDDTITMTAMWTNTPFEVQFLYPNGVIGATFDKYHTEYDASDNPIASSQKDIVYKSEVIINNLITKDYNLYYTEVGKTQIGWAWKFATADDSTYATLDLNATLVVLGNICVKPIMVGKVIEVNLDVLGGTIATNKVYITYETKFDQLATAADGQFVNALSSYVPEKDGYVFKGWYYAGTLITDETLAKGSAVDPVNFDLDSITLVAAWEDIFQDVYENLQDEVQDIVPGLLESDATYDANGLLEKVVVKVDVDSLLAGNINVIDNELNEFLDNVLDYVAENYQTLETLIINGIVVYDNGLINNEGIANLYANYMTDFDTDNSLTIVAECGTVTRTLVVEFAYKDGTTQDSIDAIDEIVSTIESVVEINYHTGEVNITIPASVVVKLEALAADQEITLEELLATYTVADILEYVFDEYTSQDFKDNVTNAYDAIEDFLNRNSQLVDDFVNSGIITVNNGQKVDTLSTILDTTLDQLYDTTASVNDKVVYSTSYDYAFDASPVANATAPYLGEVKVTISLVKNKYSVEFYQTNDLGVAEHLETITDYVGKVAAPAQPAKVGYAFEGWYSVLQTSYTTDYSAYIANTIHKDETVKLYAHFSQNDVVITYDANNGKLAGDAVVVDDDSFGTTYDLVNEVPTRQFYDFVGWTTVKDDISTLLTSTSMISNPDNHTVYAYWTATEYVVEFVANNGNGLDVNDIPSDVIASEIFTVETLVAEFNALYPALTVANNVPGFDVEWVYVDDVKLADLVAVADAFGKVQIVAKYSIITYTITFVAEGNTVGTVQLNVKDTTIVEPTIPAKDGYVSEYEAYAFDVTAPADLTVNAIYTEKVFNLEFDIAGGLFDGVDSTSRYTTIKYNEVLDITPLYTSVYKAGNAFAGWYYVDGSLMIQVVDDANFDYAEIIALADNSNVKLVARWVGINYNVSFNVDSYSYTFGKIVYGSDYRLTETYSFPTNATTAKVFTFDIYGNEVVYQRGGADLVLDIAAYDPTDPANDAYYTITVYNYIIVRFYDVNGNLI